MRGGHYHRRKHEYAVAVQGSVECLLYEPSGRILERIHLTPGRQLVHIAPGIGHRFENRRSGPAQVFILSTTRFDPNRPDKIPAQPTESRPFGQSSNPSRRRLKE